MEHEKNQQGASYSSDGDKDKKTFYPNTDLSVWLRTCYKETKEPLAGNVSFGKIPAWLSGSLIRNGPGGVDIYGKGSCKHLFDAPGLLQKFQVHNGTASYSSKYIESKSYIRNITSQRLVLSEFGTVATADPCQTIFARIAQVFLGSTASDNANISIHPFGDEIYSLSEFPFAHRINLESMETIETINVHNKLGIINHSAHPHISGRKVYNIGQKLSLWLGPHYIIAEMDTRKQDKSSGGGGGGNKYKPKSNRSASVSTTASSVASSMTNLTSILSPVEVASDISENHVSNSQSDLSSSKSKWKRKSNNATSGSGGGPRSPWSNCKIVASIPSRWPLSLCYMHTFSVTQSYFILVEQPFAIFLPSVPLNQISGHKPLASCLKFYPEEDTVFHVISRHASKKSLGSANKSKKSFHTSSFFFLHTINAYEMKDNDSRETFLVVDICCYNDPSMIDCMYVDALKNAHSNANYAKLFRGRPKRFLLKLEDYERFKGTNNMPGVESEMIVDIGCEVPRINENFDGKPYNFFYAISSDVDRDNPGTLIKVDVLRKTYDTWCEPNAYPSEPIFVPRPNSQREDDGVVLSTVVYGGEDVEGPNNTSLIILNATSWDLITRIDFSVESAVPKCLHGWYFPDESQKQLQQLQRQPSLISYHRDRSQSRPF